MKTIPTLIAAAALALAPTTAFAGVVIIDVQTGPEVQTRPPVAAVPDTRGPATGGSQKDWYKAPVAETNDPDLWANQCWTSPNKVRKTAGTQGADGLCIWNNGTLSSVGTGGRAGTPGKPGSAYVPGLYETPYWGIELPSGDHSWDHVHEREE